MKYYYFYIKLVYLYIHIYIFLFCFSCVKEMFKLICLNTLCVRAYFYVRAHAYVCICSLLERIGLISKM